MNVGIGSFQNLATQQPLAERVVVNADHTLADATPNGVLGRVSAFAGSFSSATVATLAQENRAANASFVDALSGAYGNAIAGAVHHPLDDQPLSAARIAHGLEHADLLSQAKENLFARAAERHALDAQGATDPQEGPIAQDQDFLDAAMAFVMPDVALPPHARDLAPYIRGGLQTLLPIVAARDATPDQRLLASLGTQLADRLEPLLQRGLERQQQGRLDDLSPEDVRAQVAASDGLGAIDGLDDLLSAEIGGFVRSVGTMLARLDADSQAIATAFGTTASARLTQLRIADSDPHKGGNRVGILTLDNGHRVVYKPRDMRIDAAIAGSGTPRPSLLHQAGAASTTYRFLPRHDQDGHYGYTHCLSNGRPEDHFVPLADMPAFYATLGRSAAALLVAGSTDIHHENIMTSGAQPYLTDLEFALNEQVTAHLHTALFDADEATAKTALGAALGATMLDKAFTSGTDDANALAPRYEVRHGVFQGSYQTSEVTESVWATRTADGQLLDNRYAPPDGGPPIHARFADSFGAGLADGLRTLTATDAALTDFLDDIQSFQVRHHPRATMDQRNTLSKYQDDVLNTPAPRQNAALARSSADGLLKDPNARTPAPPQTPRIAALATAMGASYQLHDVPYFSRRVDQRTLLHDGTHALQWTGATGQPDDQYFGTPADATARRLAARLPPAGSVAPPDRQPVAAGRYDKIAEWSAQWLAKQDPETGCGALENEQVTPARKTEKLMQSIRSAYLA